VRNRRGREGQMVLVILMLKRVVIESSCAILIFQHLSRERKMFDRNNSIIDPGSLYHNIKEFRLAVRQYAIDKEFELGVEAMDKIRYRGYCQGGDCPWSINARLEHKRWDVVVV
jgi:hypothetical protein